MYSSVVLFLLIGLTFGELAKPKIADVPYFVMVQSGNFPRNCIGAILKPNLVITPLNCIRTEDNSIHAGVLNDDSSNQIIKVKEIDRRIFGRGMYVAALLTLEKDLELSNTVQTIKMLKTDPPKGSQVTINGYGRNFETNLTMTELTSINLNVMDYEECSKAQSTPINNEKIMCLIAPENRIDGCKTISPGSLLTCKDGDDTVLCGLPYGGEYCLSENENKYTFFKSNVVELLEKYGL